MKGRTSISIVLAAALSGCTALTPTDLKFLDRDGGGDGGPPDCAVDQLRELPEQCHDQCDNDGDGLVDCEDEDCEHYCCGTVGSEDLACNDQCDNDGNGLIDCEDPLCRLNPFCRTETPGESECEEDDVDACCSNGIDDDDNGATDCADDDCARSDRCCDTVESFTDGVGEGFDRDYWVPFGGRDAPVFDTIEDRHWLVDWASGDQVGGVATARPVDLSFGLRVEFTTEVVTPEPCLDPEVCPSYSGIAISPLPAPLSIGDPEPNLSVLVTSSNHVTVVRGGLVLHRIGIEPSPGSDVSQVRGISVDLLPAAGQGGVNGFRMELRVPNGRHVCQPDGTSLGCPAEEVWVSEDLVLLAEDNVLDEGGRGAYVMVVGRGDGVRLGDFEGHTTSVTVRGCTNPAAWRPGSRNSYVGAEVLCWAVGALGSPSVEQLPGDDAGFGMVLHGTTRDPVPSEYGINNYSLGWLHATDEDAPWNDPYTWGHLRRRPIDTEYDLNCMGELGWLGDCTDVPATGHPEAPAEGCREQDSHRSPHILQSSTTHHILYAQSLEPASRQYMLRAAQFGSESWSWSELGDAHDLRPEDLVTVIPSRTYRSLRDPVAICHDLSSVGDCGEHFMVLAVAEAESGGAWAGDDLIYLEYYAAPSAGFTTVTHGSIILGPDDANPLRGRELSEPFVLWDPDTEQFFLWVTSGTPGGATQVDLLLAPCEGCEELTSLDHPLEQTFELYEGSPVLSSEDLELILRPEEGSPWVDCSGRCELGGVSAVRLEGDEEQDTLHLWVGVAEMPASGDLATWGIHHLTQPFGLPGR